MFIYFVETAVVTRRLIDLGLESALADLQAELTANPLAGALDPGTGGLRKIRLRSPSRGKGKRGGARAHYLYIPKAGAIYLVFLYGKDEQATLSPRQKKVLKNVAEAIKGEFERKSLARRDPFG